MYYLLTEESLYRSGDNARQVKLYDALTTSIFMNTPLKTIKKFIDNIYVYKEISELPEVMRLTIANQINEDNKMKDIYISSDKRFILYKSNQLRMDWTLLNILYGLWVSCNPYEVDNIIAYNETKNLSLFTISNEVDKIDKLFKSKYNLAFNTRKFIKTLNKLKIDYDIKDNKFVLNFRNIKIGNKKEGFILYDYIHIAVMDGKVTGFVFRFKDFDFSSYWNFPIILHPHLSYANKIVFTNDRMEEDLKILKLLLRTYTPESATKKMSEIVKDFMHYRRLWFAMKFTTDKRNYLSKNIFKKVLEQDISFDNITKKGVKNG